MYIWGTENTVFICFEFDYSKANMLEVITWGLENLSLLKFFHFLCFSHAFISPFLPLPSRVNLKGEKMFLEGDLENWV